MIDCECSTFCYLIYTSSRLQPLDQVCHRSLFSIYQLQSNPCALDVRARLKLNHHRAYRIFADSRKITLMEAGFGWVLQFHGPMRSAAVTQVHLNRKFVIECLITSSTLVGMEYFSFSLSRCSLLQWPYFEQFNFTHYVRIWYRMRLGCKNVDLSRTSQRRIELQLEKILTQTS